MNCDRLQQLPTTALYLNLIDLSEAGDFLSNKRPFSSGIISLPCTVGTKRRRLSKKRVRWNLNLTIVPAEDNDCKQDREGLSWTKDDRRAQAVAICEAIKTKRSARAYVMGYQRAFKTILSNKVEGLESLLLPEIMAGLAQHDYRGMEALPPSRGKRITASIQSIVKLANSSHYGESSVAEFSQEASQADRIWALVMGLGDERAIVYERS